MIYTFDLLSKRIGTAIEDDLSVPGGGGGGGGGGVSQANVLLQAAISASAMVDVSVNALGASSRFADTTGDSLNDFFYRLPFNVVTPQGRFWSSTTFARTANAPRTFECIFELEAKSAIASLEIARLGLTGGPAGSQELIFGTDGGDANVAPFSIGDANSGYAPISGFGASLTGFRYHVAIVYRASGLMDMYVNGGRWVSNRSTSFASTHTDVSFQMGCRAGGVSSGGVALYYGTRVTSLELYDNDSFTPPSTLGELTYLQTGAAANNNVLLHFDGANGDTAITNQFPRYFQAAGDARLSTAQKKFGASSLRLDGVGDSLVGQAGSGYGFAADFTIDFWMRSDNLGSVLLFDTRASSSSSTGFAIYLSAGDLRVFSANADRISGPSVTTNVWQHVALTRSGTSMRLFLNGVQAGSTYTIGTNFTDPNLVLGSQAFSRSSHFAGYIDEFRVLPTTAAWTANFTPPTIPYT